MEVGYIYNKSSFTNLSDTDLSGGWSVSGGKLISPADTSKPLQFSYVSGLWQFERKIITNKQSTKIHINNIAGNFYGELYINAENKLVSFFSYGNETAISTDSIVVNSNDLLEYSIVKNGRSTLFSVKNLSTNQVVTMNANVVFAIHKLRIICSEVTEISSYSFKSTQQIGGDVVVGDSIAYGSDASSELLSWVGLVGFSRLCGPGDRSVQALLLLPEILNFIKPNRIIYAMGTNDSNVETWKNNIQNFRNKVNSQKITFIPITPYANNTRDLTPFSNYIKSNFQIYFDLFSATKEVNATDLKTDYNSGDGVHPNNAGHQAIANAIMNDTNFNYYKNFSNSVMLLYMYFRKLFM